MTIEILSIVITNIRMLREGGGERFVVNRNLNDKTTYFGFAELMFIDEDSFAKCAQEIEKMKPENIHVILPFSPLTYILSKRMILSAPPKTPYFITVPGLMTHLQYFFSGCRG